MSIDSSRPTPPDVEERLRDAARAYTSSVEPDPYAWTRLRARLDETSARRLPWRPVVVLGALASVVALLIGLLVQPGDDPRREPAVGGGGPAGVVVVTGSGDLVVDPDRGASRTLVEIGRAPHVLDPQLAVSPDARFVYAAQRPRGSGSRCGTEIVRVGIRDGASTVVARHAASPAVSPDGTRLAYIEIGPPAPGHIQCRAAIVVRDLATGVTRRWVDPLTTDVDPASGVGDTRFPNSLVWAPDGRHLAFSESYEADNGIFVLDVESPEGRLAATEVRVTTNPGPDGSWSIVGYFIDGSMVVRSRCYGTLQDCPGPTVVAVLDSSLEAHTVATISGDAANVVLDQTGSALLFTRYQRPGRGTLERLQLGEDEEPSVVASGVRFATFLPATEDDRR